MTGLVVVGQGWAAGSCRDGPVVHVDAGSERPGIGGGLSREGESKTVSAASAERLTRDVQCRLGCMV